jgi:hypothetical protein
VRERWKSLWSTLFGNRHRWTGREKVLQYVVRRIDAGAPLQEVVREEYVRRNDTRGEIGRMLTDRGIVEGARECSR